MLFSGEKNDIHIGSGYEMLLFVVKSDKLATAEGMIALRCNVVENMPSTSGILSIIHQLGAS